jgi:hypothetical protein
MKIIIKAILFLISSSLSYGADLNIDQVASIIIKNLKTDASLATPHPLALKLVFGNIADSDPYYLVGIRLTALLNSNDAANYKVIQDGNWVRMIKKESDQCIFSYRKLGMLNDDGIVFQCLNSDGGTLIGVRLIICDIYSEYFYIDNTKQRDTVLKFRGSAQGSTRSEIEDFLEHFK